MVWHGSETVCAQSNVAKVIFFSFCIVVGDDGQSLLWFV